MPRLSAWLVCWCLWGGSWVGAQPDAPSAWRNLGGEVNSGVMEVDPVLSPNGQSLFFVRNTHPQNIGSDNRADIWVSLRLGNGTWGRAVNAGPLLNTRADDRVVSAGPAAKWVLLHTARQASPPRMARKNGRTWRLAETIEVPGLDTWEDVTSCFLSAQGDILYLAWDQAAGYGATDIYYAQRLPNGQWSAPINCGPALNTPYTEDDPVLAPDGQTLYFLSNRPGGQGQHDLWMSRRADGVGAWLAPRNLGPMVNTPNDETRPALAASGQTLMMARPDTNGVMHLFERDLNTDFRPYPVSLLSIKVEPAKAASTTIEVLKMGQIVPQELASSTDGSWCLVVPGGAPTLVSANHPQGYVPPLLLNGRPPMRDFDPTFGNLSLSPEYYQREALIGNLTRQQLRYSSELLKQQAAVARNLDQVWSVYLAYCAAPADPAWVAPSAERYRQQATTGFVSPGEQRTWQRKAGADSQPDTLADGLTVTRERFRQWYEQQGEQDLSIAAASWGALVASDSLTFEQLVSLANDSVVRELAPQVIRILTEDWVGEKPADDTRSWRAAGDMVNGWWQEKNQHIQPLVFPAVWLPWQRALFDEIRQTLATRYRTRLFADWQTGVNQALQSELSRREQEVGLTATETELRRVVLEQVREEERRGATFPTLAPGNLADAPAAPSDYRELTWETKTYPVAVGEHIRLEYVGFAPNSPQLNPESTLELQRLARWLNSHPEIRIEIAAHTHGWLSHATAVTLAAQRARTVADYLIGQGIARNRISPQGYGKTQPLQPNDTPEGRQHNQRIEMVILAAADQ